MEMKWKVGFNGAFLEIMLNNYQYHVEVHLRHPIP